MEEEQPLPITRITTAATPVVLEDLPCQHLRCLAGIKLSSLQRHGLANGSTAETRLGEESNGSSDPDLTQAKVRLAMLF